MTSVLNCTLLTEFNTTTYCIFQRILRTCDTRMVTIFVVDISLGPSTVSCPGMSRTAALFCSLTRWLEATLMKIWILNFSFYFVVYGYLSENKQVDIQMSEIWNLDVRSSCNDISCMASSKALTVNLFWWHIFCSTWLWCMRAELLSRSNGPL